MGLEMSNIGLGYLNRRNFRGI